MKNSADDLATFFGRLADLAAANFCQGEPDDRIAARDIACVALI
jgi:hypothetical protein